MGKRLNALDKRGVGKSSYCVCPETSWPLSTGSFDLELA